jgi:pyruvate dehydrogenase E2 component (dihydrolipoamide acetyltransferase)
MARLLRMPEVAANAVEAVLSHWPVPPNLPFSAGDAIATVETEKAVIDVPADADGVILSTLVEAGALVEVGTPIALLGDPGELVGDVGALLATLGVGPAPELAELSPSAGVPAATGIPVVSTAEAAGVGGARIFSSPLARRLAREAGLSIADLRGSGPGGRIVRRDVEQAARTRETSTPGPATSMPSGSPAGTAAAGAGYVDLPHSRMRRAIATRLTESAREAPHFYLHSSARVDRLLKLRARLNDSGPVRISVNDLVVMAAARAYALIPAMNVIWTPDAVRSFSHVDISVAIATESGLVTPVLRNVDQMTLSALAATSRDLVDRARSAELRQPELEGGTLTVTNLGMFGTQDFAAIINPPQSAVLAVGAALARPVASKGRLRVGTVMSFTLSVDHRPIDGATAAQWMAAFVSLLEDPVRTLI